MTRPWRSLGIGWILAVIALILALLGFIGVPPLDSLRFALLDIILLALALLL